MTKKPLSKRAKVRLQRLRRDPFGRFGLALRAYLETIGWSVVVVGKPQIRGFDGDRPLGKFEFVVEFTGGKRHTESRTTEP